MRNHRAGYPILCRLAIGALFICVSPGVLSAQTLLSQLQHALEDKAAAERRQASPEPDPASQRLLDQARKAESLAIGESNAEALAIAREAIAIATRVVERSRSAGRDAAARAVADAIDVSRRLCTQVDQALAGKAPQREHESNLQARRLCRQEGFAALAGSTSGFTRSGNALVGGTGWVYGLNVPPGQEHLRRKAEDDLAKQMELAGLSAAERRAFVSTAEYNFIVGVAASQSTLTDLLRRVGIDNLTSGEFTAEQQQLYATLRQREFGRLDCHSNGAMVCLAALVRSDTKASSVRLFGPQITRESLGLWQNLIDSGKVQSIDVFINKGDPISPASMILGDLASVARVPAPRLPVSLTFWGAALKAGVEAAAPGVRVTLLDSCPQEQLRTNPFACHDMRRYQTLVDGPDR